MSLFKFFFPEEARFRQIEEQIKNLTPDAYNETAVRDRLRKEWEEKHLPKSTPETDLPTKVATLEGQIETSHLIIEALLEELVARGGISREDLAKRMHEIDARDGKIDGRKSA